MSEISLELGEEMPARPCACCGGEWDEETVPESRYRVGMIICPTPTQYEFSVVDPTQSSWSNGPERFLTRDEVLRHPLRDEFFRVGENVIDQDHRVAAALLAVDV